ncbi:hypothetical protein [Sphingomonas nostoxanthinifaciens]|uniref:hypothetical protein n=1 Tax=Sphingomonas nostoxanthinifaciens TaxID=2872652 RepID=UPI001CC1DC36|nr:hypothetical protein [Sphingomonas nostoxanthinifaciens]UAK23681.1 hypothetical protein K8P63_15015 [Sphingomonas nostoxanthinifaciens]
MADEAPTTAPTPSLIPMPSEADRQAALAAALASAAAGREAGLASLKALVATAEFASLLATAKDLATFMGSDQLVGSHLTCMITGMTTLQNSLARI